jgi:sulfur-carrier protein adenylyltransferase/sulfurtransferase
MNHNHKYKKELETHEYQLFARQLILPQIQVKGQKRLRESKILFIGAGGLASTALLYLGASGIGQIGLVDSDTIELSNLNRQVIFNTFMLGKFKVTSAKNQLQKINPKCNIQTYKLKLTALNSYKIIQPYDIIIDCTDNFKIRYIISDTCKILHKIHLYGALFEFEGQVSVFNYKGGPSYQDISPILKKNIVRRCDAGGVLGVIPGLVGILQATEALKIITGIKVSLSGYLLVYNAIKISFKNLSIRNLNHYLNIKFIKNSKDISSYHSNRNYISINELQKIQATNTEQIYLIDVRSIIEYQIKHLKTAINIPLKKLKKISNIQKLRDATRDKKLIIYCNNQVRSQAASTILIKADIKHFFIFNFFL